ncbi:unnamed protein product, partial [Polarella glacialis]
VRLAAVHSAARVAEQGDSASWQAVAALIPADSDELVRVAAARAVGRMATGGDVDALEILRRAQSEAPDRSVRLAATDAEARLLGSMNALPFGSSREHPLLGGSR